VADRARYRFIGLAAEHRLTDRLGSIPAGLQTDLAPGRDGDGQRPRRRSTSASESGAVISGGGGSRAIIIRVAVLSPTAWPVRLATLRMDIYCDPLPDEVGCPLELGHGRLPFLQKA
jgi:hypothetical protein